MSKIVKHYPLTLLLKEFRYFDDAINPFRALIHDLGDNAEIISDALHLAIQEGKFGCYEDGVCAILWALFLDAQGRNFLHEEYDALRNGAALQYLLQDLVIEDSPAPKTADFHQEVTVDD